MAIESFAVTRYKIYWRRSEILDGAVLKGASLELMLLSLLYLTCAIKQSFTELCYSCFAVLRASCAVEQRVFMCVQSGSVRKVKRRWRRKFHDVMVTFTGTIRRIANKLRESVSFLNIKVESKRRVFTEKKLNEIGARHAHSARRSVRRVAHKTKFSKS